jgi:hypothetical protein
MTSVNSRVTGGVGRCGGLRRRNTRGEKERLGDKVVGTPARKRGDGWSACSGVGSEI